MADVLAIAGLEGLEVQAGTEDMPDAYRHVPVAEEELALNIVGVWDPKAKAMRYQVLYGHVFGKAAAVINFH